MSITHGLVEDPFVFALGKHLEDFLVQNWTSTELGQNSCNVSSRTKRFVVPSYVGGGRMRVLAAITDPMVAAHEGARISGRAGPGKTDSARFPASTSISLIRAGTERTQRVSL